MDKIWERLREKKDIKSFRIRELKSDRQMISSYLSPKILEKDWALSVALIFEIPKSWALCNMYVM